LLILILFTFVGAFRVRSLLEATLKVFSHELSRLWDDLSPDIEIALSRSTSGNYLLSGERGANMHKDEINLEVASLAKPIFEQMPISKIYALKGTLRLAILPSSEEGSTGFNSSSFGTSIIPVVSLFNYSF
jgi:hypothetical protein